MLPELCVKEYLLCVKFQNSLSLPPPEASVSLRGVGPISWQEVAVEDSVVHTCIQMFPRAFPSHALLYLSTPLKPQWPTSVVFLCRVSFLMFNLLAVIEVVYWRACVCVCHRVGQPGCHMFFLRAHDRAAVIT